jgi:predicted TIM-barrel fold metal-dependent hydrolase
MDNNVEIQGRPAGNSFVTWNLVDADAHIDPPHEMWVDYLPNRLKELAPRIEEGEDCDYVVFEGKRRPLQMIGNQAGRKGENFKMKGKRSEMRQAWIPSTRLADMDEDGIETAILFGGGPLGTMNSELYIESYSAYSRWARDFSAIAPKRLVPIGYVPMRDVDETIGIVRMLAKMGFKAINIPAFPQNPDGWSTSTAVAAIKEGQGTALTGDPAGKLQYWQPEFDKLWAEIVDLGLVVTFHLGGRIPRFGEKQYFLADMPMSKLAMAEPIGIFVFNGILQRFPDLKIASVESGVGWMSWFAEYCDRTWEKQRFWTESVLTEKPSFYMDRQVFGSFIQDRIGIVNRNQPGGRNILWSSDYPHSETTFPISRDIIARDFDGVPLEAIKDITSNFAAKFFNLV